MNPRRWPAEGGTCRIDGGRLRQVTEHRAIHHHPFFFVPAWDVAERHLVVVSHRTGTPQIFVERAGEAGLVQLTDRPDLGEWSVVPDPAGRWIYFVASGCACRVHVETGHEETLAELGAAAVGEGDVGAAMGTTALSASGRWWAVPVRAGGGYRFWLIDTEGGRAEVFLEAPVIGHPQFCPDDDDLILYAGPMTDRVWLTDRAGRTRRAYAREDARQWVTHEVWWPGRRAILFVDWPRGIRALDPTTGEAPWITRFPVWHGAPDAAGRRLVCDTAFPDRGLHLIALDGQESGRATFLCRSEASSQGAHWAGPFPYNDGPVKVRAPQHTHPHPRFSPAGDRVVFTSDRTGHAQVYEFTPDPPS